MVVSYSRTFGPNRNFEGQGISSLKKHVTDVLTTEEVELHNRVIRLRDTAHAHSDARSHLLEGYDYNKYMTLMQIIEPLDKSSVEKLKIMIEKWFKYLEAERSRLKEAKRSTSNNSFNPSPR